jgi:hypothetical protein
MGWILSGVVLGGCLVAVHQGEAGRAGVVLVHGDGTLQTACVSLDPAGTSGQGLLEAAGWATAFDASNPMGVLVCSIEGEGCDYPNERCWCRCTPGAMCSYWAYFTREPDGEWGYGVLGASSRQASNGSLDAWVWLTGLGASDAVAPLLAPVDFETVCGEEV